MTEVEKMTNVDEVVMIEEHEQVSWVQDKDNPERVNVRLTNGSVNVLTFPDEQMAKDYAESNTAARKKELDESEDVTITKIDR